MARVREAGLPPEVLAAIRRLYYRSRRLADAGVSGSYRSAFRGQGIEFEEVRQYVPGDDTRAIDWKVTARSGAPFIKSYREERELQVLIAVDVSASTRTGTRNQERAALLAQIGSTLTLIARRNNDRVGLVTFSDRIEHFVPPSKHRGAAWQVIHEVFAPRRTSHGTDFRAAFEFLGQVLRRHTVLFILSDFFGELPPRALARLSKRHDLTAVIVADPLDRRIPAVGLAELVDAETNERVLLNTSSASFRRRYQELTRAKRDSLRLELQKSRVAIVECATDQPFLPPLQQYFSSRGRERGPVSRTALSLR